jgi:hypothetical protein
MGTAAGTTVAVEPATKQRKRLIVSELPRPGRAREDHPPASKPTRIQDSTPAQEWHAVFRLLSPVFCLLRSVSWILSPEF